MRGIEIFIAGHVPALQAGAQTVGSNSWGYTPGYYMTGFQPGADMRLLVFMLTPTVSERIE